MVAFTSQGCGGLLRDGLCLRFGELSASLLQL